MVAVYHRPGGVDGDEAVGVAVERQAGVGAGIDDRQPERFRVGRAAAVVDVAPVGVIADDDDVGTESLEGGRRHFDGGAVGAVEHHAQAVEAAGAEGVYQVVDIAVDVAVAVVDGDHVIAICARDLRDRGRLHADTVVVTVMTNLGFHLAMAGEGIAVVTTPVGDRYVLGAMEDGGWSLGGEQSGHVIFRDMATTGDGVLTGLVLLDVMARKGTSLAALAESAMTRLPQVLVNVRVTGSGPDAADRIAAQVAAAEARLGTTGRVLVRASGTEPVVRVMVEAATHDEAETVAAELADALATSI